MKSYYLYYWVLSDSRTYVWTWVGCTAFLGEWGRGSSSFVIHVHSWDVCVPGNWVSGVMPERNVQRVCCQFQVCESNITTSDPVHGQLCGWAIWHWLVSLLSKCLHLHPSTCYHSTECSHHEDQGWYPVIVCHVSRCQMMRIHVYRHRLERVHLLYLSALHK
jgi:hypothetical protein